MIAVVLVVLFWFSLVAPPFFIAYGVTFATLWLTPLRDRTRRRHLAAGAISPLILLLVHLATRDGLDGTVLGLLTADDTEYATGYSAVGFWRVRPGMTMNRVQSLVGPPLDTFSIPGDPGNVGWRWARSRHDSDYHCRVVLFRGNTVTSRHSEYYLD